MGHEYSPEDIVVSAGRLDVATSGLMVALARAVGVSVPELIALEQLDHDGSLGPSDLARRLQMTTGAVTALVDRLEKAGYVRREPHPRDRRRVLLKRTRAADDELAEQTSVLAAEIQATAESLANEERAVVGGFLDHLTEIVEHTTAEACAR